MQVYLFILFVVLLVIGIFVFQNPSEVILHFFGWESTEISLGIIILIAVLLGALITFVLDTVRYYRIARTIKQLRKENHTLNQQLKNLQENQEASTADEGNNAPLKEN